MVTAMLIASIWTTSTVLTSYVVITVVDITSQQRKTKWEDYI